MTIKDLEEFLSALPREISSYKLSNGEEGGFDEDHYFRIDSPITSIYIDEKSKTMVFCNEEEEGGPGNSLTDNINLNE